MTVGLVLVSHSAQLAAGVAELAGQMVQNKVPIVPAGGTDEGELGTSVDKILTALQTLDSSDGTLVLLDLGSALLSTDMAIEMLEEEQQQRVRLTFAPLVEGAVTAAMECSLGHTLAQVQQAAEEMADVARLHQLKPVPEPEEAATAALEEQETAISTPSETTEVPWQMREVVLTNPTGLHARPASLLVQTAARFTADIRVSKGEQAKAVKAKSILSVLSLAARKGEHLLLEARGEQAAEALQELAALVEANFYETLTGSSDSTDSISSPDPSSADESTTSGEQVQSQRAAPPPSTRGPWTGTSVSPGVALGEAFLYDAGSLELSAVGRRAIESGLIAQEQQRLQKALSAARTELEELHKQVQQRVGESEAAIFEAHAQMLSDPGFVEAALQAIADGPIDAASALAEEGERQAALLAGLNDPLLAARAVDMRDAVSRAIQQLGTRAVKRLDLGELSRPVILVARDLTPSDTVSLNPKTVLGICTVQGGPTSHAAILARSLGIPAIAGLHETLLQQLHSGDELALDADKGQLYLAPPGKVRADFQQRIQARQEQQQALQTAAKAREPLMIGGQRIQLLANVGSEAAAEAAHDWGAEGIGLLRTEFLFAQSDYLPSEDEQRDLYVRVFRKFLGESETKGRPIVVRTLDAGADKPLPALKDTLGELVEANPALGLRGIRIHLAYQNLLVQQLRAILRAAGEVGNELHVMFPMITTVEEVRRCREIFEQVRADLRQQQVTIPENVSLGIMVEVPAAAIMSADLAREVDFFSIGSNDLTQYTLACDRTNPAVTDLFPQMQPSVLRSIRQVVEGANQAGKPVAVCGELASDVHVAPVLVGLGVQELSMTPTTLPTIRAALSNKAAEELRSLAQRVCAASTVEEVNRLLA